MFSASVARPSLWGSFTNVSSSLEIETVLFSFEGSDPHVPLPDLLNDAGTEKREEVDTSILENCIEKNFHVPNMKSGPPAEGGCNFE
jgi:hypothetical protein